MEQMLNRRIFPGSTICCKS